jgi:poly(hydroxyalkanoate) granule-associated protein
MVTKSRKTGDEGSADPSASDLAGTVKESAQQIWLAGLGAFSKAQEEGGKVFQALVKEGLSIQRKTQSVAGDKLNDATARMASMASELSSKASGQWDKLESIFEDRVARALKKLGVPTAQDVTALEARIEELQRSIAALRGGTAGPRTTARSAARKAPGTRPAPKTVRKHTPARKAGGE